MNIYNSIRKRTDKFFRVKFDKITGFYRHDRFGKYVYIRHPSHLAKDDDILWRCEKLFFNYYQPKNDDVVVDLGAGYGDEALYIAGISPDVTYIAVEAQPVIFECLANTFRQFGENFVASPYAITDAEVLKFVSHHSYAEVGNISQGYVEVPTMRWPDFLKRYKITKIDLFKMNIESAEKELVQGIDDFSFIKRFIISCHDFRANKGDGEWFRTKDAVIATLKENGYSIKSFNYGMDFADDWVYAERES
ncbi:MAG: FkbM family methyltransferase [Gammaproteobacteria bacterium]|nr:FkbM family methyltransferase [Gammaproteobacteria bacterium]